MRDLMRVTGLTSGIDWESMIQKLMSIERRPVLRLERQQNVFQVQKNAWLDVNGRLKTLFDKLAELKTESTFLGKTATSTDKTVVTATATTDAQAATYDVLVQQLATATEWRSSGDVAFVDSTVAINQAGFGTAITAGSFTLTVDDGTNQTTYSISIDPGVDTLDDLLNRIQANTGITATYDQATDKITLDAGTGKTLILGAPNDTSNFLGATGLLDNATGGQSVTGWNVGRVHAGLALDQLNLRSALDATGSFTINGKIIKWDRQADTLDSVIDKINSSGAGVTASYDDVNDRLIIRANETGPQNIDISDDTGGLLAAFQIDIVNDSQILGQKAKFSLNGTAYESASNEVSGLISGVTLNLKKVSAQAVTVTVAQDLETAKGAIQAFVDQYNSLMDFIAAKLDYGDVTDPNDDGDLAGDPALRRLQSSLRSLIGSPASGVSGPYDELADIGVATSGSDPKLEIDTARLEDALKSDPAAVFDLFFDPGSGQGLAAILGDEINTWIRAGEGRIPVLSDGLQDSIDRLDQQIEAMERRLDLRENNLYRQFTTMEKTLARLQSQGDWLTAQLAGLNANWLGTS